MRITAFPLLSVTVSASVPIPKELSIFTGMSCFYNMSASIRLCPLNTSLLIIASITSLLETMSPSSKDAAMSGYTTSYIDAGEIRLAVLKNETDLFSRLYMLLLVVENPVPGFSISILPVADLIWLGFVVTYTVCGTRLIISSAASFE